MALGESYHGLLANPSRPSFSLFLSAKELMSPSIQQLFFLRFPAHHITQGPFPLFKLGLHLATWLKSPHTLPCVSHQPVAILHK